MELKLEVLNAEGLADGEYRFGDLTSGFLGRKELNPYVVVKLNQQSQQSSPIKATASEQGASGAFKWKTLFEVSGGPEQLTFQVFDKKGIQAIFRGDPLIGEATLALPQTLTPNSIDAAVTLKSGNGEKDTGRLHIRYGLVGSLGSDGTSQWLESHPGERFDSSFQAPPCPVISMASQDETLMTDRPVHVDSSQESWTLLTTTNPAPALERTDSWESFKSAEDGAEEEGAANAAAKQSEAVAKRYMEARMSNDLKTLKDLLSSACIIQLEKPWGGSASYRGWDECKVYYNDHKAEPGKNFKHWRHSETEVSSPAGSYSTTVVIWVGQVYKFGWRSVQSSITVDSQNQIVRIHLVPSVSLSS